MYRHIVFILSLSILIANVGIAEVSFSVKTIKPPRGYNEVSITGVNSAGEFVGFAEKGTGDTVQSAAVTGQRTKIALLPSAETHRPLEINEKGEIVGFRLNTCEGVAWSSSNKQPRLLVPPARRATMSRPDCFDIRFDNAGQNLSASGLLVGSYIESAGGSSIPRGFLADLRKKKFSALQNQVIGLSDKGDAVIKDQEGRFLTVSNFRGKGERGKTVRGDPIDLAVASDGRLFGNVPGTGEGRTCALWRSPTGRPVRLYSSSSAEGICKIKDIAGIRAIGTFAASLGEDVAEERWYMNIRTGEVTVIPNEFAVKGKTLAITEIVGVLSSGKIFANGTIDGLSIGVLLTPR